MSLHGYWKSIRKKQPAICNMHFRQEIVNFMFHPFGTYHLHICSTFICQVVIAQMDCTILHLAMSGPILHHEPGNLHFLSGSRPKSPDVDLTISRWWWQTLVFSWSPFVARFGDWTLLTWQHWNNCYIWTRRVQWGNLHHDGVECGNRQVKIEEMRGWSWPHRWIVEGLAAGFSSALVAAN